jgi:surface polysaccharide O-acyltransferase-like enzyme
MLLKLINMEYLHHHQWLHIFVAAIAYFALGAIWYTVLFGKQWMQLNAIDMSNPNNQKGVPALYFKSFVCMFIATVGIDALLQHLQIANWQMGLKLGLAVGLFFASTAISINYVYTRKPIMLYLIDCLYQTIGLGIAGAILAAWK